jgi:hypothetical protein
MASCETTVPATLCDVFLADYQDAQHVIQLPGGRHVRFEWCGDAPEIDAVLSMDEEARGDALRATASFDS